ncbi:hypothetical protein LOTGIDRAFT_153654 [Lottia gigantea]|uniref:Uncharacterized protein n=1 Tax=Lottia gigantea TaxID=225164 RepID=V4BQP8_LOTGI|nr:hypothetical protein LOTGIDRAFT_153654 [Lottia gigantea]ESO91224.1 hypothetical protein LOTGIDRAFT_153654 [Lottia gigantea]
MEGIQAKIKAKCRANRGIPLRPRRQGRVPQNNKDDSIIGDRKGLDIGIQSHGDAVVDNIKMKGILFEHHTKLNKTSTQQMTINNKGNNQQLNLNEKEESSLCVQMIADHIYSVNVETFDKYQIEGATSAAEIYRQFLITKPTMYFQELNLLGNNITQQVPEKKPKSKVVRIIHSMRKSMRSMMGRPKQ